MYAINLQTMLAFIQSTVSSEEPRGDNFWHAFLGEDTPCPIASLCYNFDIVEGYLNICANLDRPNYTVFGITIQKFCRLHQSSSGYT